MSGCRGMQDCFMFFFLHNKCSDFPCFILRDRCTKAVLPLNFFPLAHLYLRNPPLAVQTDISAIHAIRGGRQRKGGGAGVRDRKRKRQREENTKLADMGHNLISTVGGQLCSVICHGSPFRLQWQV